jgi:hypothetical protein
LRSGVRLPRASDTEPGIPTLVSRVDLHALRRRGDPSGRTTAKGPTLYEGAQRPLLLELASAWHRSVFPTSQQDRGRTMKARANHKTPQKPTFTPKPLSIEQRNAIDLLILGKTDQETADRVGVSRETVWSWHHEHPIFMSTLERRRAEV